MACYFDGVNVSFFSHGFSATPHQQATGSECFHLFIWFVSSCDYLVVMMATVGSNQSERSKFRLDQSESRISPM